MQSIEIYYLLPDIDDSFVEMGPKLSRCTSKDKQWHHLQTQVPKGCRSQQAPAPKDVYIIQKDLSAAGSLRTSHGTNNSVEKCLEVPCTLHKISH